MLDHWFRLDAAIPPGGVIEFEGLATQTEVWLDGALAATHATMFRPLLVPVPPAGVSRLEVCARALTCPAVKPRPRWRNRLVPGEGLRSVRTSLEGRIPGTGEPVVGPFGAVWLHAGPTPLRRRLRTWLEDGDGVIEVRLEGSGLKAHAAKLRVGDIGVPFAADARGLVAVMRLPKPGLWWPHTHGAANGYPVDVIFGDGAFMPLGDAYFRTVERAPGDGFGLLINGVAVFCRGALWSGEGSLGCLKDAGFNMVRIPGTACYARSLGEADSLGLMVWQDFMFSRFDYPTTPGFVDEVRAEVRHVLAVTSHSPSLVVLCGGDEVAQAAAMAGRPAEEWRHSLFDEVLASEAAALRPDVVYVPNAPSGAAPPFAGTAPIAHYFGVGAYQRPLHEAAGVRFAAACLAFSNPPDAEGCRALCTTPGDAEWAAAVPRDPGATWTFEDARDHYARTLFGVDPASLRRTDPERWLAVGRAAVAVAMQSAMSTWRADPQCGGALILALQDLVPGAGWGLIDHAGRSKSALHAVAQVSQPIQVLLRDAGLDGVLVYVFNDGPAPLNATLSLRGLDPSGAVEALGAVSCSVRPHGSATFPACEVAGRFQDLTGAWRFGPAPYRVLGAVLSDGDAVLSTATHFVDPVLPREDIGLVAVAEAGRVRVSTSRFAQFVTLDLGREEPELDHFHLWPGETALIPLRAADPAREAAPFAGTVSALNGLRFTHFRGLA